MYRLPALCILALALQILPARPEEAAKPAAVSECAEGDFLCDHDAFHPIYQGLEAITGKSCCHKNECRPAVVREADGKKNKGGGTLYEAFIDGRWCPVYPSAALRLSETQKEELRSKVPQPLLREFLARTHACAPQAPRDGPCPTVYCFWKLPDMY